VAPTSDERGSAASDVLLNAIHHLVGKNVDGLVGFLLAFVENHYSAIDAEEIVVDRRKRPKLELYWFIIILCTRCKEYV
jgi:hypothetical protein